MFQTMMSDLFIGFVRCFLTFRRVVKEREKGVKVVLHCELLFTCKLEKRRFMTPLVPHLDQVVVRAGHKVRKRRRRNERDTWTQKGLDDH